MAAQRKHVAIPLDPRGIAARLGLSYQTVVRIIGTMADDDGGAGGVRARDVWTYQAMSFRIFERHTRHKTAKCGTPKFFLISRYGSHTIGGEPGRVRARLRQKSPLQWLAKQKRIKKLAFGKMLRRRERANDKHKASPTRGTGRGRAGRPLPTANRAASRFKKWAVMLQGQYDRIPAAPRADLHGWIVNRMREQHCTVRIERCLKHAVRVLPTGRYAPKNPAAWVSEVATRHLESDGLGKVQRKREWLTREPGRQRAAPATLKGKVQSAPKIFVDSEGISWKHLGGTHWEKINA